jgi:hypothetical protein
MEVMAVVETGETVVDAQLRNFAFSRMVDAKFAMIMMISMPPA